MICVTQKRAFSGRRRENLNVFSDMLNSLLFWHLAGEELEVWTMNHDVYGSSPSLGLLFMLKGSCCFLFFVPFLVLFVALEE